MKDKEKLSDIHLQLSFIRDREDVNDEVTDLIDEVRDNELFDFLKDKEKKEALVAITERIWKTNELCNTYMLWDEHYSPCVIDVLIDSMSEDINLFIKIAYAK